MQNVREALRVRVELLICRAYRAVYRQKIELLKSQYILEKDDVERVKRSFFARLKNNYEAKLGKEKAEALKVRLELERTEKLFREAEEQLPALQEKAEGDREFWGNAELNSWNEDEKHLLAWCEEMELLEEAAVTNDRCLVMLSGELRKFYDGKEDEEELIYLQKRVAESYIAAEKFLESIGRLRVMEGTTIKTVYGERRVLNGGSTKLFMRRGHSPVELRMRNFDFEKVKGGLHISEALLQLRGDLEEVHQLFAELLEEKVEAGKELMQQIDWKCESE